MPGHKKELNIRSALYWKQYHMRSYKLAVDVMVAAHGDRWHALRCILLVAAICGCSDAAYAKRRKRNNLPWQSESGQDRYLVEQIFRNRRSGFFVELGAADGQHFSNTYALEHGMNWSGILIEPMESQARRCATNRLASVCVHASRQVLEGFGLGGHISSCSLPFSPPLHGGAFYHDRLPKCPRHALPASAGQKNLWTTTRSPWKASYCATPRMKPTCQRLGTRWTA